MSKIMLEVDVVRGADGKYDLEKMLDSASNSLLVLQADKEVEEGVIRDTVSDIFDQFKGTSINTPALISMASQKMNALPANFKTIAERVGAYLRENSQGDADKVTKLVPRPNSLFVTAKGKGGGIRRRADIVAAPSATTEVAEAPVEE